MGNEVKGKTTDAMSLHKQGYSYKEIADELNLSAKAVEHLLRRARNPKIHELQGHYRLMISTLDDPLTIRGKYMEVTLTNLLLNLTLTHGDTNSNKGPMTYNLVEFLYNNIWIARMNVSSSIYYLIDSDGFQKSLTDVCDYYSYKYWQPSDSKSKRNVFFPRPESIIETRAKTKGWWWTHSLKEDVYPLRYVLRFDIYQAGDTSGWVKDNETIEFEFSNSSLVAELAARSFERFKQMEIGQAPEDAANTSTVVEAKPDIPQKIMDRIRAKAVTRVAR
jgi:transcriptional regulator